MAEKFGIENLKEVVLFGVRIGKQVAEDLKDKKMSIAEILALVPPIMQIPTFLEKKDLIVQEAEDLSVAEVDQIVAAVKSEQVLTKQDVIDTIKDSLNIVVSVKNLIIRYGKKAA